LLTRSAGSPERFQSENNIDNAQWPGVSGNAAA